MAMPDLDQIKQGEQAVSARCVCYIIPDVYLRSNIGFGMDFGMIEKRPAFEQYWQRLSARPAALRAKEIDDALMAQQAQSTG
jgi:hypothetical protein